MLPVGPNLLIVSDDGAPGGRIATILAEAGFAVTMCGIDAAMVTLARTPVDVAVVAARRRDLGDIGETIRRVRQYRPALKALYLTDAFPDGSIVDTAQDAVCDMRRGLPYEERRLMARLYELLLSDGEQGAANRHQAAAEFGIDAARRACLDSRSDAAVKI